MQLSSYSRKKLSSDMLLYCIENQQFNRAKLLAYPTIESPLNNCQWVYLLNIEIHHLDYDPSHKVLYINNNPTPHIQHFEITANNGIWLHVCLKDISLARYACNIDATSGICLHGICRKWKI